MRGHVPLCVDILEQLVGLLFAETLDLTVVLGTEAGDAQDRLSLLGDLEILVDAVLEDLHLRLCDLQLHVRELKLTLVLRVVLLQHLLEPLDVTLVQLLHFIVSLLLFGSFIFNLLILSLHLLHDRGILGFILGIEPAELVDLDLKRLDRHL